MDGRAPGIRAIGVFQPSRNPYYPNTPAFRKAGYDVFAGTYFSLIVPKDAK